MMPWNEPDIEPGGDWEERRLEWEEKTFEEEDEGDYVTVQFSGEITVRKDPQYTDEEIAWLLKDVIKVAFEECEGVEELDEVESIKLDYW